MLPDEINRELSKWNGLGLNPHYTLITHPKGVCYVVFRTLTKGEFISIRDSRGQDNYLGALNTDIYKNVIDMCILYPNPLPDDLPAFADKMLFEAIVEASGWLSTDKLIECINKQREEATTLDYYLKMRIISAIPHIKLSDFNNMRIEDIIEYAVIAENLTGVPLEIQPWVDPEGYEQRINKEKKKKLLHAGKTMSEVMEEKEKDPEYRKRILRKHGISE